MSWCIIASSRPGKARVEHSATISSCSITADACIRRSAISARWTSKRGALCPNYRVRETRVSSLRPRIRSDRDRVAGRKGRLERLIEQLVEVIVALARQHLTELGIADDD